MLTKIILKAVKHPDYVRKARLTFIQKPCIARIVSDLESQNWVWSALKRLNEARNELAYGLPFEEIKSKLDDFIRFVKAEQGVPETDMITP